jgi:hypothetical protein
MTRVLATVMKAPIAVGTSWRATAITDLTAWIKEIVDGARAAPMTGGLLRNYLNDTTTGHGFGEISGSSLIAAVAYRMVVLAPQAFPTKTYVPWADSIRKVLGSKDASGKPHITSNGTATPAVNPLAWLDTKPWTAGRYSYSLWLDVRSLILIFFLKPGGKQFRRSLVRGVEGLCQCRSVPQVTSWHISLKCSHPIFTNLFNNRLIIAFKVVVLLGWSPVSHSSMFTERNTSFFEYCANK